jgi:hypothetical protein
MAGADGQVVRVASADKRGEITVTLMASSLSNDFLSAQAALDDLTGINTQPLLIKDLLGTTLISAQQAWIKKPADVEFGKEAGTREWVFECGELNILVGGSI